MDDDYFGSASGPQTQDEPDASDAAPGPDDAGEADGETLFIPETSLGGRTCEPGDVLTFTVVGKTSDGELEVELDKESTDEDYASGSDKADAEELRVALSERQSMSA